MAEKLTSVELNGIELCETKPRQLVKDSSAMMSQVDEIETALGTVHVDVQGDRHKPAIITYHDIGLNSTTCFQGFINHPDMIGVLRCFCLYHINAPGQQEGAFGLPHKFHYPTMDQLAEMIVPVVQYYDIKRVIGFGVGAGANILARYCLSHPEKVEALILINPTSTKCGWTEWGYQKMNLWYLKSGSIPLSVEEYLLWHWFGEKTTNENHDLVSIYKQYIHSLNPHNLAQFIESYVKRTDLGLVRELDPSKKKASRMIRCPVMLVSGDTSPHLDDTIHMNTRMDPSTTDWLKFDCGGMVLEEQPDKMCESFRLFLQGMGYIPSLSQVRLVEARSSSRQFLSGSSSKVASF